MEGTVVSAECSSGPASSKMGSGQSPALASVAMTLLPQMPCALEKKPDKTLEKKPDIAHKSPVNSWGTLKKSGLILVS